MTQTRRKRKKQGAKRSVAKTAALRQQLNPPAVPAKPKAEQPKQSGLYIDRPSDPSDRKGPPIKQTSNWLLASLSARLWLANWKACIVLLILPLVGITLGGVIAGDLRYISDRTFPGLVTLLLSFVWAMANIPPSFYMQVKAINGHRPGIWESYRGGYRRFFKLFGLTALVTTMTIGGLLLLIVPGIIVARRYLLAAYYLYDQPEGTSISIREIMRQSAEDSKPVALNIWGVYAVYIFFNLMAIVLFARTFMPYGQLIAATLTSLYIFGPGLRYREVALRKTAASLFEDRDNH